VAPFIGHRASGSGVGLGLGVGLGVGVGLGDGVGLGLGLAVGEGLGLGVGSGVAFIIAKLPAARTSTRSPPSAIRTGRDRRECIGVRC
jgi:hypothetical protein